MRDLFGNMPVRIKQRPDETESRRQNRDRVNALKKKLVSIVLAWGRPVDLDLTSPLSPARLRLRVPPAQTLRTSQATGYLDPLFVQRVLRHAEYIDLASRDPWMRISARTSQVFIQGVLCLKPAPSKAIQFISLGIEPLYPQTYGDTFVNEINRLFITSDFGAQDDFSDAEATDLKSDDRSRRNTSHAVRELRRNATGVDRWPSFVIRIEPRDGKSSISQVNEDSLADTAILEKIKKSLTIVITKFLKDNSFKPRARTQLPRTIGVSSSVHNSSISSIKSPFHAWSRVKSGTREDLSDVRHWKATANNPSELRNCQLPVTDASTSEYSFAGAVQGSVDWGQRAMINEEYGSACDTSVAWYDPFSNDPVLINARTGFAMKVRRDRSSVLQDRHRLYNVLGEKKEKTGVLQDWKNPVFSPAGEAIRRVCYSDDLAQTMRHKFFLEGGDQDCMNGLSASSAKLSKSCLKMASVIAQVDQKFILISMDTEAHQKATTKTNTERMLVLIDQHAADERIHLEDLFSELCASSHDSSSQASTTMSNSTTLLPSAMVFQITSQERSLFENAQSYFTTWGIVYDINNTRSKGSTQPDLPLSCRLSVKSLPPLIAERCHKQPKILIDLLRIEIWDPSPRYVPASVGCSPTLSIAPSASEAISSSSKTPSWLEKVHSMPRGLLEMLKSRACRSAIMFNDILSLGECRALVSRLSDTRFPFQCAHGRPSVVPLLGVGAQEELYDDTPSVDVDNAVGGISLGRNKAETEGEGFLEAYRKL